VINGFDAMHDTRLSRRKVAIPTARNGDGIVCTSVRDYGVGLPEDARERVFDQQRRLHAERDEARRRLDLVTPREFEVMQLVITGMLNKQIAGELRTAEKTVKVHRGRVMQKLGVTSVAELMRLVQRAHIEPAATPKTKVL
jgi:DNA-binding NarL/FixJ family response regulator